MIYEVYPSNRKSRCEWTREEKGRSLLAIKFAFRGKYRRGEGRGFQKEEEEEEEEEGEEGEEPTV